MLMAVGILLIFIGLLMLMKPTLVWLISESWKTNNGTEPSKLYLWSIRLGGIIMSIIGLTSFVVFILI